MSVASPRVINPVSVGKHKLLEDSWLVFFGHNDTNSAIKELGLIMDTDMGTWHPSLVDSKD